MANHVVIFPADRQAEAEAYQSWTDAHWRPPETFAYCRPDAEGRWVVPYLGPPFLPAEPDGGEAMRASGSLSDTVTWPSEDASS